MKKTQPFDISQYFAIEAEYIRSICKKRATLSHKVGNIVTAGDIVERTVRTYIKERVPNKYYVTQGHIIDQNLSISNQFDILIADDKGSPNLVCYENGTNFLTYESIYAIGEVKSSYSTKGKKEPVKEFVEKVRHVNEQFHRDEVDMFQRSQDYKVYGNSFGDERTEDGWCYKNPLFKFMFFVQSTSLKLDKVIEILNSFERKHQPNLICFLDKGILVKVISDCGNNVSHDIILENYPEFQRNSLTYEWRLLQFTEIGAATLAYTV